MKNLIGDYEAFLDKIFALMESQEIEVKDYFLDHICYRVQTVDEYNRIKTELLKSSVLLSEALVGGRPIATVKLNSPLIYKNRKIYLIELPFPREGKKEVNGLEHVEFVIDTNLQEFMNTYSQVEFNTKGISKSDNPDIKWTKKGLTIKFHEESLETVIERENNANN